MKTTIEIQEKELNDLMQYTKAKTKKEAVATAIKSFNRQQRILELTKILGTFEDFMTNDELQELRRES